MLYSSEKAGAVVEPPCCLCDYQSIVSLGLRGYEVAHLPNLNAATIEEVNTSRGYNPKK